MLFVESWWETVPALQMKATELNFRIKRASSVMHQTSGTEASSIQAYTLGP